MKVCAIPGCPELSVGRNSRCAAHLRQQRRTSDAARPNARARGYDARWETTSAEYLAAHPKCECDDCSEIAWPDRPNAEDVHHRDNLGPLGPLGHDWSNLQALTHAHHSHITAKNTPAIPQRAAANDG